MRSTQVGIVGTGAASLMVAHMRHRAGNLQFHDVRTRIAHSDLIGGEAITMYRQQEVVMELVNATLAAGAIADVRILAAALSTWYSTASTTANSELIDAALRGHDVS